MHAWSIPIAALSHRRGRALLAMASIAVATAILTVSFSVFERLSDMHSFPLEQELLVTRPIEAPLTLRTVDEIRHIIDKIPGAQLGSTMLAVAANDGARYQYLVLGFTEEYPDFVSPGWFDITPEVAARWRADKSAIIAGVQTAMHFGWKVGDLVSLRTSKGLLQGKVVGIANGFVSRNVVVRYDYLDRSTHANGDVHAVGIRAPRERFSEVIKAVDTAFESSPTPTTTLPIVLYQQSLLRAVSAVPALVWRIGVLFFAVTAVTTASMLSSSLRERRHEFATLRAIGFSSTRVLRLVLVESLALALGGGLLGAILPYALFHAHGLQLGEWALSSVTVSWRVCALALVSAFALGLFTGILPALATARRNDAAMLNG
jgi:putative ABC transport system permease protein